jgi:hypothetical protein
VRQCIRFGFSGNGLTKLALPPSLILIFRAWPTARRIGVSRWFDHLAGYGGIMQADAFAGFNGLYDAKRQPAPISEAACWSYGRRKFFDLPTLSKSPIAAEAVRWSHELFEIERTRSCQGHPLHPQPPSRVHPLPQRRPDLYRKSHRRFSCQGLANDRWRIRFAASSCPQHARGRLIEGPTLRAPSGLAKSYG